MGEPNLNPIQQAAANFMNNLLGIPSQFTSTNAVTDPATDQSAKDDINFGETFPKLNLLSTLWHDEVTAAADGPVRTSALRALLSDATFHRAINGEIPAIDLKVDIEKSKKELDLIALAAAAKEEEIGAISNLSPEEGKRIFCILYKELKEGTYKEPETVAAAAKAAAKAAATAAATAGGAKPMSGGTASPFTDSNIRNLLRATGRKKLPIFTKNAAEISELANAQEALLRNQIFMKVTANWDANNIQRVGPDVIVSSVLDRGLPELEPNAFKELQQFDNGKWKDITKNQWRLALIEGLIGDTARDRKGHVNTQITTLTRLGDLNQAFPDPHRSRVASSKTPSSRPSATSTRSSSPTSEGPPKELGYVSNYSIKSYILIAYKISIFEEQLPTCGNPIDPVDSGAGSMMSNAKLSGDTPPNCYTNGDLLRVSPWVKHTADGKIRYYLACQACGLPMFPPSLTAPLLTDDAYNRYDNPFAKLAPNGQQVNNPTAPSSKEELFELAGKTQCDHDAPLAMMYNGLNRNAEKFPNIGIGSNFCPLHPSCNTKKTNISPAVFWDKNKGKGSDEYKWNERWTGSARPGEPQKFPPGPWDNNEAGINTWCQMNKWDPRYYAQLLQWKYFSALEELVKQEAKTEFGKQLKETIAQAVDLYRSIEHVKTELKRVVQLLRSEGTPINVKNIVISMDVAETAAVITTLPIVHRAQTAEAGLAAATGRAEAAEAELAEAEGRAEAAEAALTDVVGQSVGVAMQRYRLDAIEREDKIASLTAENYRFKEQETERYRDSKRRDDRSRSPRGEGGTRSNKKKSTRQTKKKLINKKPRKTKRKNKKKNKRTIKK